MDLGPNLQQRYSLFVVFRVVGYVAIGCIALLLPQTGENRFLLGGLLILGAAPLTLLLTLKFQSAEIEWLDPLFDLTMTILLVHLVPQMWVPALCIGLMITLAPSLSLHPNSHRVYASLASLLVGGMAISGSLHEVPNWWLMLLVVSAVYPSVIFYARWQVRRIDALRARSQLMQNLHQLSGSVAHDFNNILTSVGGHAELALRSLPKDAKARQDLLEVMDGVDRAGLLCRQLLSFSMQADSAQTTNLVEEIRSLIRILKPVVPKGVRIDFHTSVDILTAYLHRPQFQQVLMNLILNAGEAMVPSGGVVRLEAHKFTKQGDAWVRVIVSDTGQGMDRDELDNAFDPLFTTKARSYGLGLANARRILRAHGGEIHIDSELGRGTKVTLELPLSFVAEELITTFKSLGGRALVVDDEASVRAVTQRFLEGLGFQVEAIDNAEGALARLRAADFQLMVLDLEMPGADGWWCLDELRKFNADIPVVVASGYDPQPERAIGTDEKVAFLSKPYRTEQLEKAIGLVLI